jgi:hypothetical protein
MAFVGTSRKEGARAIAETGALISRVRWPFPTHYRHKISITKMPADRENTPAIERNASVAFRVSAAML